MWLVYDIVLFLTYSSTLLLVSTITNQTNKQFEPTCQQKYLGSFIKIPSKVKVCDDKVWGDVAGV